MARRVLALLGLYALVVLRVEASEGVVSVSDEGSFKANLASKTTLELSADIGITTSIEISGEEQLTIDGMGLYKVDGQGSMVCFFLSGDATIATFQNLEITGGFGAVTSSSGKKKAGAIVVVDSVVLSLTRCTISRNGGGIYISGTAPVVSLTSCIISNNTATGYGSGVGICIDARNNLPAVVSLVDCEVSQNSALDVTSSIDDNDGVGGAIFVYGAAAVLSMTGSTISNNRALVGGGIAVLAGTISLDRCTLSGNYAEIFGGGIYSDGIGNLVLSGCRFLDNSEYSYSIPSDFFIDNEQSIDDITSYANIHSGTLVVLSICPSGTYNAGVGLLQCNGPGCAGVSVPQDLLTSDICTACSPQAIFSCCGATNAEACVDTEPGDCTDDQELVCLREPTPLPTITPAPSITPRPTFPPSSAPSPSPSTSPVPSLSPAPSPAPSPDCQRGSYYVAEIGSCVLCPAGTFANVSTPPWPSYCERCASGFVQPNVGGAHCSECDFGKFANTAQTEVGAPLCVPLSSSQ